MIAAYVPILPAWQVVVEAEEVDVRTVEDVFRLVRQVRLEYGRSASEDEGGVPAITLDGMAAALTVAPVDERFILSFELSDGSMSYTSVDPNNTDGDDQTYWFWFGGSVSELPQRYSIAEDLAMAAVSQFLADSTVLPEVPGLEWEQDWE